MNAKDTALCIQHELRGCYQTVTYGSNRIDLIIDTREIKEGWFGDLTLILAQYAARVVSFQRHDEYRIYTIAPVNSEYFNPHRRKQISLKLERSGDADILEFLDHVPNVQGLIKSLIRDHMAAKALEQMEIRNNADRVQEGL